MSDTEINIDGFVFEDWDMVKAFVERSQRLLDTHDQHAKALGALCMSYAGLDEAILRLYEPLLQCTEAQAVCVADEGISRRSAVVVKLLHLIDTPDDWLTWVIGLLRRADGELGPLRNRLVHHSYTISLDATLRHDRRPRLKKPQSRQKPELIFDTEHPTSVAEIERVSECVSTVQIALAAAHRHLVVWRTTGEFVSLDPQWLPAATVNARCLNYEAYGNELERPISPLEYAFD